MTIPPRRPILDALAERFDDKLAAELKKFAAHSRLIGDCLIHPQSKARALMKAGELKKIRTTLRTVRRHPNRLQAVRR